MEDSIPALNLYFKKLELELEKLSDDSPISHWAQFMKVNNSLNIYKPIKSLKEEITARSDSDETWIRDGHLAVDFMKKWTTVLEKAAEKHKSWVEKNPYEGDQDKLEFEILMLYNVIDEHGHNVPGAIKKAYELSVYEKEFHFSIVTLEKEIDLIQEHLDIKMARSGQTLQSSKTKSPIRYIGTHLNPTQWHQDFISYGLVDEDTSLSDFTALFTGRTPDRPISFLFASTMEFRAFIDRLIPTKQFDLEYAPYKAIASLCSIRGKEIKAVYFAKNKPAGAYETVDLAIRLLTD